MNILKGVSQCVRIAGPLRNEVMACPDFWALMRNLLQHKGTGSSIFDIVKIGVSDSSSVVLAHNYEAIIGLLEEFALAAGAERLRVNKHTSQVYSKSTRGPKSAIHDENQPSYVVSLSVYQFSLYPSD